MRTLKLNSALLKKYQGIYYETDDNIVSYISLSYTFPCVGVYNGQMSPAYFQKGIDFGAIKFFFKVQKQESVLVFVKDKAYLLYRHKVIYFNRAKLFKNISLEDFKKLKIDGTWFWDNTAICFFNWYNKGVKSENI